MPVFFRILYTSGMRVSELRLARIRDINFGEGYITVHTGKGPRIHDFRHTYCVNLLRKWSDEGKDLIAYLPYMRTMLGHESFEETAYYLKLTAERFPYIKERMMESFPDLIREAVINEHEFY